MLYPCTQHLTSGIKLGCFLPITSLVHHACCPNFSHLKCTRQFLEAETKGQDVAKAGWCKSRGVMEPW